MWRKLEEEREEAEMLSVDEFCGIVRWIASSASHSSSSAAGGEDTAAAGQSAAAVTAAVDLLSPAALAAFQQVSAAIKATPPPPELAELEWGEAVVPVPLSYGLFALRMSCTLRRASPQGPHAANVAARRAQCVLEYATYATLRTCLHALYVQQAVLARRTPTLSPPSSKTCTPQSTGPKSRLWYYLH